MVSIRPVGRTRHLALGLRPARRTGCCCMIWQTLQLVPVHQAVANALLLSDSGAQMEKCRVYLACNLEPTMALGDQACKKGSVCDLMPGLAATGVASSGLGCKSVEAIFQAFGTKEELLTIQTKYRGLLATNLFKFTTYSLHMCC